MTLITVVALDELSEESVGVLRIRGFWAFESCRRLLPMFLRFPNLLIERATGRGPVGPRGQADYSPAPRLQDEWLHLGRQVPNALSQEPPTNADLLAPQLGSDQRRLRRPQTSPKFQDLWRKGESLWGFWDQAPIPGDKEAPPLSSDPNVCLKGDSSLTVLLYCRLTWCILGHVDIRRDPCCPAQSPALAFTQHAVEITWCGSSENVPIALID